MLRPCRKLCKRCTQPVLWRSQRNLVSYRFLQSPVDDKHIAGREINRSASSSNTQLEGRPDNTFFEDVMAGGPRPPVQVDCVLRNGRGFQLSTGMEVPCAVFVVNGEALLWDPKAAIDKKGVMTMETSSFGILDVSSNKPDMLIIGTGTRNEMLAKEVRTYLHSLGIQIDTMDTRNAASTFNVLAAEGRSVAVALLPG